MKKKKRKLREKIKNRPKSRNISKNNKKRATSRSLAGDNSPAVVAADEGNRPMSEVIWDFAGPILETCNDLAAEKKAISVAIFVWNSCLLPEEERKDIIESYLADCRNVLPQEEMETLSSCIDQLIQDKEMQYADNRNKITNCTFGDFNDDRHIEVGYTIE